MVLSAKYFRRLSNSHKNLIEWEPFSKAGETEALLTDGKLPFAFRFQGGAGELFRVLSTITFMTSVCCPGKIWCHKPQIVTQKKTCGSKKVAASGG